MTTLRDKATFYRAALLLGLVPGETVVQWAHDVIEREHDVPSACLDVVLIPPGDLTSLRHALQPLCDQEESSVVLAALFDCAGRDLMSGRRGIQDSVTVLSQVRRFLTAPPAILDDIDSFVDDFMLATAGVVGDVAKIDAGVRAWLARYSGAAEALWAARVYHVVEFERDIEAAAFVAALSRFLDSPAASAAVSSDALVEAWSAASASSNSVTLYLTDGALQAASFAFSPVPVVRRSAHDGGPPGAVLVLDGRTRLAMGVEQAEQRLSLGVK
ncbi:MAG: hypothetical protein ABI877_06785 [Gemmatimonadaceae bacterium]